MMYDVCAGPSRLIVAATEPRKRVAMYADAVAKKATASASKIKENAVTEADEKVEVARLQGLKDLYDELGFTSEKHKASLDYLLTLMASSSNKEYVAFDSMGKVTAI